MSRTASTWSLPDDLASDWRSLAQLIEDTVSRQDVPCVTGSTLDRSAWSSDIPEYQQLAADACLDCPLMTQCAAYGRAHPKEQGVYGGLTPSERKSKNA